MSNPTQKPAAGAGPSGPTKPTPGSASPTPGTQGATATLIRPTDSDLANLKPLYPVARLIKGAVLEAEQERAKAREILQQALAEAERIINDAKTQAEGVLAAAREQGQRDGLASFQQLLTTAAGQVDALTQKFSSEVTRIAFRIAREVLAHEFAVGPDKIIHLITGAIEHLRSRFPQRILVHLHPEDFELVQKRQSDFTGVVPPDVHFSLVKDNDLQRHEVLLETEMGHYDFSVESQLKEIGKVIGG